MTYEEKIEKFRSDLKERSLLKSNYLPPLWWLLVRVGFKAPPPVFWTKKVIFWTYTSWFTIFWGLGMWFFSWQDDGMPWWGAAIAAVLAGVMFGYWMTWWTKRTTKLNTFGAWRDYSG